MENSGKRLTTEGFIEKAQKVHDDKYDYSKVEYVNNHTKVCIICPEHGEFWQQPNNHLCGKGCLKCGKIKRKKEDLYKNYENWLNIAKQYESLTQFHNMNRCAYDFGKKNGWLYKCFSKKKTVPSNKLYFTYDDVKESALQCSSRSEFNKKHNTKYRIALKNGWIVNFKNLLPKSNSILNNYVYYYHFEDLNTIYVGRTNNIVRRDKEHRNGKYIDRKNVEHRKHDTVYEFGKLHNVEIPQIQILEQNLNLIESQEKEDFYLKKFKNEGFNLLNKSKTGIGIGSIGKLAVKYTYQKVYDIAKTCKTKKEFAKKYPSISTIAYNNGWVKTFEWLETKYHTYTLEECIEVANKYNTKKELRKNESAIYSYMVRHKWIGECNLKDGRTTYYTKEKCFEISKKYTTLTDFRKNNEYCYNKCKKEGWLKEMTFLTKTECKYKCKYSKEMVMNIVKKYSDITEFTKNEPNLYSYIRRTNILNEVKLILMDQNIHWTDSKVKEEALKYEYYNDFAKNSRSAFNYATRNGLIKNFTWLKKKLIKYDIDECIKLSMNFKTLKEFRETYPKELRVIQHANRISECTWLKKSKNQFI